MAIEKTLVLIKPDGMRRRLAGFSIDRLDTAGLEMVGAKIVSVTEELAREHYKMLEGKSFFPTLIKFMTSEFDKVSNRRVLALVYKGENAIQAIREVVGATNPEDAAPGTIRCSCGKLAPQGHIANVVHASGNAGDAERELKLWFKPGELVE
ncbi:MAG: nucleoside-diphosphate kinase [Elusimicrobia bacterium RIFOXYB2_FULL_62_6]|nr:MAG: nucleoside-diphosphate kinase [Elusimicrobia bacterium RIFOXYB2_FULL_62_6]